MTRRLASYLWTLAIISLMVGSLMFASLPPAQAAAPTLTSVTVTVLSYPSRVGPGEPITVRWRIEGGTVVSRTHVWYTSWDPVSGLWSPGEEFSGGPGDYEDTFTAGGSDTITFYIQAIVDGQSYSTAQYEVSLPCGDSDEPNNTRAQAKPIDLSAGWTLLTSCLSASDTEDWYVATMPACTALHLDITPAHDPTYAFRNASVEAYDADQNLLARASPECGGGYGPCNHAVADLGLPAGGTLYLRITGEATSYSLGITGSGATSLVSDEFDEREYCDYCLPAHPWMLINPLGLRYVYEPQNYGGSLSLSAYAGSTHDLHETTNAPRLMQNVCSGDFAAETLVSLGNSGSYAGAGLLVWQDTRNFFRWEINDSGGLRAFRMRNGAWTDTGNLAYVPAPVALHVQRVGARLDYFAQIRGVWTYFGSLDLTAGAVQVGLHVVSMGTPDGAHPSFDYFHSVAPLPIGPTPTPTISDTPMARFIWQEEAEHGTLAPPMAVYTSTAAMAGRYVASPANNAGGVYFPVGVPRAGRYYLWARAKGESWTNNSFLVAWDDTAQFQYEISPVGGQWTWGWDRVHTVDLPEDPFPLTAGQHMLYIRGREPNAGLDALVLTDDPNYVPEEGLTPTPTATSTPTTPVNVTPTHTPTAPASVTPTNTPTPEGLPTATPAARCWLPLIFRP